MGLKGDLVKDYITEFPNMPNLTLARLVYAENPEVYSNVEAVRRTIRCYKGQCGEHNRQHIVDKTHFGPPGNPDPFDKFPEGIKQFDDFEPYEIKGNRILKLADIHIPFHIKPAVTLAMNYGKERNIDTLLLNGDIADFYEQSKFIKHPKFRDFKGEYNALLTFLNICRETFPDAEIIYKLGNHEERYENRFIVKAPELIEIEISDFEHLIKSEEKNIIVIKDKRTIKIGSLNIIHGHEFKGGNPNLVNPARWLWLKGKALAACDHFHVTQTQGEKNMEDKYITCWSSGCLSDLHPQWLPHNNWNLGFSYIERLDSNKFQFHNKKILKGKIYSA